MVENDNLQACREKKKKEEGAHDCQHGDLRFFFLIYFNKGKWRGYEKNEYIPTVIKKKKRSVL